MHKKSTRDQVQQSLIVEQKGSIDRRKSFKRESLVETKLVSPLREEEVFKLIDAIMSSSASSRRDRGNSIADAVENDDLKFFIELKITEDELTQIRFEYNLNLI